MKKKYLIPSTLVVLLLMFYSGFKLAIYLRASIDQQLVPNYIETFSKYDRKNFDHIYIEGLKRYFCFTDEEYLKLIGNLSFNAETKPLMEWFIKQLPEDTNILDVGGSTGVHWHRCRSLVKEKNIKATIIEIDQNAINIGKEKYKNPRVDFFHVSELKKLKNRHYDIILLSEVYMQIPNGNKVLREYFNCFPNAQAVVIHSVFKDTFGTKLINIFKQHFVKYTYLKYIQGRAMTDEAFHKEMKEAGLAITKEEVLDFGDAEDRILNVRKAYWVVKPTDKNNN